MNQRLRDWWCDRFGHDWTVTERRRRGIVEVWMKYCGRCGDWSHK